MRQFLTGKMIGENMSDNKNTQTQIENNFQNYN